MKIGFTINIGNYESFKIESSELPGVSQCMIEIYVELKQHAQHDSYIDEFIARSYFEQARKVVEGSK